MLGSSCEQALKLLLAKLTIFYFPILLANLGLVLFEHRMIPLFAQTRKCTAAQLMSRWIYAKGGAILMTHQDYAHIFKALSHPSRLHLLKLLATKGEMTVSQLATHMPREASTVSRHLNILSLHGLAKVRQEGQNRFYALNPERIHTAFQQYLTDDLLLQANTLADK